MDVVSAPPAARRWNRRSAAARVVPWLVTALVVPGCIHNVKRTTLPPASAAALPQEAPFLKSHMRDGSLYVLSRWAVATADSLVDGEGRHFDSSRRPLSTGHYRIPLDSVVLFEANVVQTSPAVGAYAAMAAVTVTGAIICITNPKACFGSCPTFYADDDSIVVQAEAFSSSVAPCLEATDVDALYRIHPTGTSLRLRMTNEALETHVVRWADVLAVPHAAGERAGRTPGGEFRTYRDPAPPVRVVAPEDGVESAGAAGALAAFDGHERYSLADSSDLAARETLELQFPARSDSAPAGLFLAARQTLLTTYLYYQTLAYLGRGAVDWLAMLERNSGAGRPLAEGLGRTLGKIDISVEAADGSWRHVAAVGETGPIATDAFLVPFPAGTKPSHGGTGEPLRVRLEMTKGMWRLDHAAIVSLGPPVTARRIVPADVRRDGATDAATLGALTRRDALVVAMPGDEYTLIYPLPREPDRFDYFLEARGWYLEWLRDEWMKEESAPYARQVFLDPAAALRRLAPEYKSAEQRLEGLFWSSRYAKQ